MILITKTIASLDASNYNFGKLKLLAQLKLINIKYNLPDYIYDALKSINCKLLELGISFYNQLLL